jgi:two-component system phosphate regulon sensor histidine kinase PhoR
MQLKKRIFTLIAVLMAAALLGLMALQLVLLDNAIELRKQAFRQNVNAALSSVVQKLETRETVSKVVDFLVKVPAGKDSTILMVHAKIDHDSVRANDSAYVTKTIRRDLQKTFADSAVLAWQPIPQSQRTALQDSLVRLLDKHEQRLVNEDGVLQDSAKAKEVFFYQFNTADSAIVRANATRGRRSGAFSILGNDGKRRGMIIKIIDELADLPPLPIELRINPALLDSLVGATLSENRILTPYAFGVRSASDGRIKFPHPDRFSEQLAKSEFKSRLFPNDLIYGGNDLVLYFPDQQMYVLKQTGVLLASSLILLAVLVFCFIYTVRTVFKQKDFAAALTDFINNMTHEFKTPISTISLASRALANPAIRNDEGKLARYTQIIQDENLRMRSQVEKILQMAVLEEGDYELNLAPIDAHALIAQAVYNVTLQIEKRNGRITTQFEAASPMIEADAVHFSSIIHNLLDNAMKYTRNEPAITVATTNTPQGLSIRIEDNGIGIAPGDQPRVFDKYFRVSTGNKHDVKGFGLGLSYVKLMVEAHGGKVGVKSDPGKGSTFEVFMPFHPFSGRQNHEPA